MNTFHTTDGLLCDCCHTLQLVQIWEVDTRSGAVPGQMSSGLFNMFPWGQHKIRSQLSSLDCLICFPVSCFLICVFAPAAFLGRTSSMDLHMRLFMQRFDAFSCSPYTHCVFPAGCCLAVESLWHRPLWPWQSQHLADLSIDTRGRNHTSHSNAREIDGPIPWYTQHHSTGKSPQSTDTELNLVFKGALFDKNPVKNSIVEL